MRIVIEIVIPTGDTCIERNGLGSRASLLWGQNTITKYNGHLQGDIIGTCFFENPDYGPDNLRESIRKGSRFYGLTLRALCDGKSEEAIRRRFKKHPSKQTLIILDNNVEISKIGGIFCKCNDGSHLAFIALNKFCGVKPSNQGLVFCGDFAETFFDYYNSFVKKYA